LELYHLVPLIIFFVVVILDLVFIPYLFFALSLLQILPPYGVIPWFYLFSLILLVVAGIIYWIGKKR